jgi:hypothetical protein
MYILPQLEEILKSELSWEWWCTTAIPVLERLRWDHYMRTVRATW